MLEKINRRNLIKSAAVIATGAVIPGLALATVPQRRKRSIRIAHLTDTHVSAARHSAEGLAKCLKHVNAQKDKPDVIFFGGDLVSDSFGTPADKVREQWSIFQKTLSENNTLPYKCCIGNHDVFGWNKERSKATGDEPLYGKNWAIQEMKIPGRYYSFDQAGWHFIILDSVFPRNGNTYFAKLDDEQFEWLKNDLEKTPEGTPVMVMSHIPIISFCTYFLRENEKSGDWQVTGAWMHIDARKIKNLFVQHKNVKLAISGHMHLIDRVDYVHTTYFCNGAVCGNWWRGPLDEFEPGYTIFNLYEDGSFEREIIPWGWVAGE